MRLAFALGIPIKYALITVAILQIFLPSLGWAQVRNVRETPIAEVRFSKSVRGTFTVSADSRRIAFVDRAAGKEYVMVDGKDQARYDKVLVRPLFSPDSRRIAYVGIRDGRKVVVADGKEENRFDDILGEPVFSPDSARLAYVARVGDKQCVVVDGVEGPKYDEIGRTEITKGKVIFSPDSRKIAYVARTGNKQFVVADGTRQKEFDRVGSNAFMTWDIPVFSPDGKKLAYQAQIGAKWFAVVDGTEEKTGYDSVSTPSFSPDGKRMGYIAAAGKDHFVVIDGVEGKHCHGVDLLTFSPDGRSVAYRAYVYGRIGGKWYFVLNGQERKEFDIQGDSFLAYGNIVFSPDSTRLAYKTRLGIVADGMAQKQYEMTGYPVFSPDSRHLSYLAGSKDTQRCVLDGREGAVYASPGSRFFLPNAVFSPDSRRIAYAARIGKKWTVIVDGTEGPLYDEVLVFPGGQKVFESFDNHPYYWGYRQRIEAELAQRGNIIFDSPNALHYLALKGNTIYLVEETIH